MGVAQPATPLQPPHRLTAVNAAIAACAACPVNHATHHCPAAGWGVHSVATTDNRVDGTQAILGSSDGATVPGDAVRPGGAVTFAVVAESGIRLSCHWHFKLLGVWYR